MNTLLIGKELGIERIAREISVILINNINAELLVEDAKWNTLDSDLAVLRGVPYVPCVSNPVSAKNIHVGHKPSLIKAPVENYPNISVMSYAVNNSPFSPIDQGEINSVTTFIETMVLDGPYPKEDSSDYFIEKAEELVNRKIQRMVEAIHSVIFTRPTLNGLVLGIQKPPRVVITECLIRHETTMDNNNDYYWQMARLEYNINKDSIIS